MFSLFTTGITAHDSDTESPGAEPVSIWFREGEERQLCFVVAEDRTYGVYQAYGLVFEVVKRDCIRKAKSTESEQSEGEEVVENIGKEIWSSFAPYHSTRGIFQVLSENMGTSHKDIYLNYNVNGLLFTSKDRNTNRDEYITHPTDMLRYELGLITLEDLIKRSRRVNEPQIKN
jgi:hypothetical protein